MNAPDPNTPVQVSWSRPEHRAPDDGISFPAHARHAPRVTTCEAPAPLALRNPALYLLLAGLAGSVAGLVGAYIALAVR